MFEDCGWLGSEYSGPSTWGGLHLAEELDEGTCIGNRNPHKSEQENTPKCGGQRPPGEELAETLSPGGFLPREGAGCLVTGRSAEHVVLAPWLQHPGASTLVAGELKKPLMPRYS